MFTGKVLKEGFSKTNIHKCAFVDNGYSTGVCFFIKSWFFIPKRLFDQLCCGETGRCKC